MGTEGVPTYDLSTPEGVRALMESSGSEEEWDLNYDAVVDANGGKLPVFWASEILSPRVYLKTRNNW